MASTAHQNSLQLGTNFCSCTQIWSVREKSSNQLRQLCCDFDMQHIKQFLYFIEISDSIFNLLPKGVLYCLITSSRDWNLGISCKWELNCLFTSTRSIDSRYYWDFFTWFIAILFKGVSIRRRRTIRQIRGWL